jgi:HSP20 family protein
MANETPELQVRDKQALEQEGTRPVPVFRPDVDILERSDAYVVYADIPGADEDSVRVNLERGTLVLDAELATFPDTNWTPVHAEYRPGSYHREFRVSEDIEAEDVSARLKDGVLELRLPKSPKHRPRTIPIQVG